MTLDGKASRHIFVGWLRANTLIYVLIFSTIIILANSNPTTATNTATVWFAAVKATGIRQVSEFTVDFEAFLHILQRNAFATSLQFLAGFLGVAPISIGVIASFYGLVVFVKPIYGESLSITDAFLVTSEGASFILGASLTSTIATHIFGIEPGFGKAWLRSLLKASRSNFRTNQELRQTLMKNSWLIAVVSIVIAFSLLTAAWIEAVNY